MDYLPSEADKHAWSKTSPEQAREEICPSKACALSDDAHASGVNTAYENARNMMDNAENMATKSKTAFDQISVNLRG
jgi:hypothetical protein